MGLHDFSDCRKVSYVSELMQQQVVNNTNLR
jgi:hypothetical protein